MHLLFNYLLICVQYALVSTTNRSRFQFTEEARAALCPFVGTNGIRCFDGEPFRQSGRNVDIGFFKMPYGVGISVDQSTGRLIAPAVRLTYASTGTRTWTDGHTGEVFDLFNEATLGRANRLAAAYNTARVHIFHNASQLNGAWQQTFADGKVRGGELARRPELFQYYDNYFNRDEALALSQRVIGLYTLTINASAVQLNGFALHALSQLTSAFNSELYDDFINAWGTHIITSSLVGGMTEEQAKVIRCNSGYGSARFSHCIPFSDQGPISPNCKYYTGQIRLISRRRLGGNVEIENEDEWKKTLAVGPALLQILEMVPWYEFVTDNAVKQNLITILNYRQQYLNSIQTGSARLVDSRLQSCISAPLRSTHINGNANWRKDGITVAGGNGAGGGINQLYHPHSLFIENDQTLYISEWTNNRVVEWKIGSGCGRIIAGGNGQLKIPSSIIVDRARDSVFICDFEHRRVLRWSLQRANDFEIIIPNFPCYGLAMDDQGFLYISNLEAHEVRRWQVGESQGTVVAGGNGAGSRLDQINAPRKIFVDHDQSVYVSESANHRVTKWLKGAKEGIVVAGGRGRGNSLFQLFIPDEIVVDQLETVYVVDRYNGRIVRWLKGATEGQIIVGGNGFGSQTNQLNHPIGLSFDRVGNLYIADSENHRIQKFEIQ